MALILLILQFMLFTLTRRLFSLLQYICWIFTGTLWRRHLSKQPEHYDRSAQLMSVAFRMKFDLIAQPSGSENFVTMHEDFVHPRYVLEDNVTLYSVTDKQAVFVETDPDIDVTSLDVNCFMRIAQFEHAIRIILLPVSSLHRLAEELGDPSGELIFVTSTARCGSTLLCQIMEETEICRSFSEPDYFHVVNAYRDKLRPEEMERLLRNCTRLLCKPVAGKTPKAHLIKPIAHFVTAVPLFLKVFPNSRQLFMYRDSLAVTRSLLRMFDQVPISHPMVYIATYLPAIFRLALSYSTHFQASDIDFPSDLCEKVEMAMFIWATTCRSYKQIHESGYAISAFKYEHLVTHPLQSIQKILAYFELPEECARTAVKAMGKDSQRGGLISIANLGKKEELVLTVKNRRVMDKISDLMELPRLNDTLKLPSTINDPETF